MSVKTLLATGAVLQVLAGAALATDPVYINNGTVTVPPDIDATTFINNGTFALLTLDFFRTQNTLNFSNNFTMTGELGYEFAFWQGSTRKMAASFFNKAPQPNGTGGLIQGIDGGVGFASRVLVMATNINNQGFLEAGGGGLVRLVGTNVVLPFSTVAITPLAGTGGLADEVNGTVAADVGIFFRAWGTGNGNTRMSQATVANGQSPANNATNYPGSAGGNVSTSGANGYAFANTNVIDMGTIGITNMDGSLTNAVVPSNSVVEVAFIGPFSSVYTADAHFVPSTIPSNNFNAIGVVLLCPVPNPVSRGTDLVTLGIQDEVASRPKQTLAANSATNPPSYSPSRLTLSRSTPTMYSNGSPGNAPFTPSLIWGSIVYPWGLTTYTNARVDLYEYDYLQGHVDNLISESYPGVSVTNFPGRVEIEAKVLNLDRTRIRGEGAVNIAAPEVTSTTNMVLDVQNILLDMGATNGTFRLTDIIPISVERLHGEVYIWAGVWTNTQTVLITNNWIPDPAGTTNAMGVTNMVQSAMTNVAQTAFHVLIVNPVLTTTTPVTTERLSLRATNVVDDANATITAGFFTDAQSFTLNGSVRFAQPSVAGLPPLQTFVGTNAPNLLYFTNNGTLTVPNDAHFGDDRATPYAAIINNASLTAGSFKFNTAYFENPGTISCQGSLALTAQSAKLENGSITAAAGTEIQGGDIKLRNYTLTTGTLDLSATNALFDAGAGSSNRIVVGVGFNLLNKPAVGDLLGTQISSTAAFGIVPHLWAGEDRGATRDGFSNNVAIGILNLTAGFGQLSFAGTGLHNGLYVDFLNVAGVGVTNLQDLLAIAPSLTIYFAGANLPAEQLDGKLGGRLRWVRDFAGPNSSVPVLLPNGHTILVNTALRQSPDIDSDADGLPNGVDPSPFDGVRFTKISVTNQPPSRSVQIIWQAAAGTVYRVEYATNLLAPIWQLLTTYTNTATTNAAVAVVDSGVPAGQTERYYRVSYTP